MNLQDRLIEIRRTFENGETPQEIIDVFERHVESMIQQNVADNALKVGGIAPLSLCVETNGETTTLKELMGPRFLVLTWFRGNW